MVSNKIGQWIRCIIILTNFTMCVPVTDAIALLLHLQHTRKPGVRKLLDALFLVDKYFYKFITFPPRTFHVINIKEVASWRIWSYDLFRRKNHLCHWIKIQYLFFLPFKNSDFIALFQISRTDFEKG